MAHDEGGADGGGEEVSEEPVQVPEAEVAEWDQDGEREERDAERRAGVAGRRLHPDLVEGALAEQSSVGDAVECDPARQAEIPLPRLFVRSPADAQDCLLHHDLH